MTENTEITLMVASLQAKCDALQAEVDRLTQRNLGLGDCIKTLDAKADCLQVELERHEYCDETIAALKQRAQIAETAFDALKQQRVTDDLVRAVLSEFQIHEPAYSDPNFHQLRFQAMVLALEAALAVPRDTQSASIYSNTKGETVGYPVILCGDHAEFEKEHANTAPEDRPDWPLPSFDARDWAKAFCKINPQIDEGTMIGWFANALMRGFDQPRDTRTYEDGPKHLDRSTPCPTCGFCVERVERTPLTIEDGKPITAPSDSEPVAWQSRQRDGKEWYPCQELWRREFVLKSGGEVRPLYVRPFADKATIAKLVEALEPFAHAGSSEVCTVDPHPIRERNRQECIAWSYNDSSRDIQYRVMLTDFRRAAEVVADLRAHQSTQTGGGE